jgi:hypothetical protein
MVNPSILDDLLGFTTWMVYLEGHGYQQPHEQDDGLLGRSW